MKAPGMCDAPARRGPEMLRPQPLPLRFVDQDVAATFRWPGLSSIVGPKMLWGKGGSEMTGIRLRDPLFEDLFDFRREFDKIFNRMLTAKTWGKEELTPWPVFNFVPPVESYVDKEAKKYVCKVSLPGIEPKEVQIHVQGNLLTISGERKYIREEKKQEALHEEFAYGKFERVLELPEGVNTE